MCIRDSILGHLQLAEPDHRVQACRGDCDPDLCSSQQSDRVAKAIDKVADRIARCRRTPIGPHHIGTLADTPDKQRLPKIAALLRKAFAGRETVSYTHLRAHET